MTEFTAKLSVAFVLMLTLYPNPTVPGVFDISTMCGGWLSVPMTMYLVNVAFSPAVVYDAERHWVCIVLGVGMAWVHSVSMGGVSEGPGPVDDAAVTVGRGGSVEGGDSCVD